jgi:hypothetical protein
LIKFRADVERLIGEGAVKTVKKPQLQQKKECKSVEKKEEIIYETFEETKQRCEKIEVVKKKPEVKMSMVEVPKNQKVQKKKVQKVERSNTFFIKSVDKNARRQPNFTKTTKKINHSQSRFDTKRQTNINYISNANDSYIIGMYKILHKLCIILN